MNNAFEWIGNNAYWIFDGIGVTVLIGLLGIIFKKRENKEKNIRIVQKGGKNSVNIQTKWMCKYHREPYGSIFCFFLQYNF